MPITSKQHLKVLAGFLLVGVVSLGCSTTPAIEKMVPQETVIYLQVPDGEALFDDLDVFFRELGLSPMLQNKPLQEFLAATLRDQDSPIQMRDLDFSLPVGMAVIPSDPQFEDTELMLFLPLSEVANPEKIRELLETEPDTWVAIHKEYLVLFSDRRLREQFPPKETADIATLRGYPGGSLQTYVDLNGLFSGLGLSYDAVTDGIAAAGEGQSEAVLGLLEGYFMALESIDAYTLALRPSAEGLFYHSDLHFLGDLADLLKSMEPMPQVTGFPVPELPGAIVSGAFGIAPEDSQRILGYFVNSIADEAGESGNIEAYLEQSQKILRETTGYYSFSVALEPRVIRGGAPTISGVPVEPAFDYHVAMLFGAEDPERYLTLYAEWVENQADADPFLSMLGVESGIQQRQQVSRETSAGGKPYLKVTTELEGSSQEIAVNKFTTYLAAGEEVVYSYLGTGGDEMLDQVINGPTRRFTEYEKEAPMALWALSMDHLVALTGVPAEEFFPVQGTESVGYLKIDGSVLRSSGTVPVESLSAIVELALVLQESEPAQ